MICLHNHLARLIPSAVPFHRNQVLFGQRGPMPDRLVRDEILESDRWLELPTDAARLAFVGFLLISDDFGNFEGGARRIFRFLHRFTQIKSEDACAAIIDSLMACDLIRRYEVEGRELFHIPRFRTHRNYRVRRYPASPWCTEDKDLGKHIVIRKQGLAKNIATTSLPHRNDIAAGVGVGVGVNQEKPSGKPVVTESERALRATTWAAYRAAYAARWKVDPKPNATVNSMIVQAVKRLGADAPSVAAFFLTHNDRFYVQKRHQLGLLVKDAEALYQQWKTDTRSTTLEARSAEQKDAVVEQIKRVKKSLEQGDLEWMSSPPSALPMLPSGKK